MLPVNCAKADPQANPRNAIRVMESQSFNLVAMLTPAHFAALEKTFTLLGEIYSLLAR